MKVVLITGATSGIGLGLAREFLRNNYKVIITGRNQEKIDKARKELGNHCNLARAENIDVRDEKKMLDFINFCEENYGIDIVIANAGISSGVSEEKDISYLSREIFDINVQGVFNTVNPFLSIMKNKRKGQIVLVSSMSAFFGLKTALLYSASKAAIKNYGEGLRLFAKDYGIDVSTIFPGFIESNITKANKFKMPFFMGLDKASKIMFQAIIKKKGFIIFPLRMYFIVYLISMLPFFVREKILSRLPNK